MPNKVSQKMLAISNHYGQETTYGDTDLVQVIVCCLSGTKAITRTNVHKSSVRSCWLISQKKLKVCRKCCFNSSIPKCFWVCKELRNHVSEMLSKITNGRWRYHDCNFIYDVEANKLMLDETIRRHIIITRILTMGDDLYIYSIKDTMGTWFYCALFYCVCFIISHWSMWSYTYIH